MQVTGRCRDRCVPGGAHVAAAPAIAYDGNTPVAIGEKQPFMRAVREGETMKGSFLFVAYLCTRFVFFVRQQAKDDKRQREQDARAAGVALAEGSGNDENAWRFDLEHRIATHRRRAWFLMGGTLASLAFMFYVHSRQGPLGIWDLIFPITAVLAYFWPFGLLMSLDCS